MSKLTKRELFFLKRGYIAGFGNELLPDETLEEDYQMWLEMELANNCFDNAPDNWVSVDEPPEIKLGDAYSDLVLATNGVTYSVALYHKRGFWDVDFEPAHWQPIEPPKEK